MENQSTTEGICPECSVPVGDQEYGGNIPFDGKHEIDTTNAQGGRLVFKEGQISEYGPCGHLIFMAVFPSIETEKKHGHLDHVTDGTWDRVRAFRARLLKAEPESDDPNPKQPL